MYHAKSTLVYENWDFKNIFNDRQDQAFPAHAMVSGSSAMMISTGGQSFGMKKAISVFD